MQFEILLVAGTRPNLTKIAPILRSLNAREKFRVKLCYTGQHYDENMSDIFFRQLGISASDLELHVGSGSHAEQTAKVMIGIENYLLSQPTDAVLVVGDVNSTLGAAIAAKKLGVKVVHVEAGLRSFDEKMPEEINRVLVDSITDLFFTTEPSGGENLLREGKPAAKLHFVGNVMIDNLFYQLKNLKEEAVSENIRKLKKSLKKDYFCLTLHRPSNVDNKENLQGILTAISQIAKKHPVIFICHPRTRKKIEEFQLAGIPSPEMVHDEMVSGIYFSASLGFDDFWFLAREAKAVLTDSWGIQEETTALKIPCITIRENTERPVTIESGSNELAGVSQDKILNLCEKVLQGKWKKSGLPELWDGSAAERIAMALEDFLLRASK